VTPDGQSAIVADQYNNRYVPATDLHLPVTITHELDGNAPTNVLCPTPWHVCRLRRVDIASGIVSTLIELGPPTSPSASHEASWITGNTISGVAIDGSGEWVVACTTYNNATSSYGDPHLVAVNLASTEVVHLQLPPLLDLFLNPVAVTAIPGEPFVYFTSSGHAVIQTNLSCLQSSPQNCNTPEANITSTLITGGACHDSSCHGCRDGLIAAARFASPIGITAVPGSSTFFLTDQRSQLRSVEIDTGLVNTVAGPSCSNPEQFGYQDGRAEAVRFSAPLGVAASPDGKRYHDFAWISVWS
jgi:hypothetical protein